ncbi:MAG: protein kinase domain-containing protein [Waterburya sp.]
MKPRTKRTQPKKCTQTICGMTCIKTGYTCHDNDPNAKKKVRERGKELVDRIQKTKVDRTSEKASTKTKTDNRSQGKLAYEQLTKDSKTGAKRSKSETYNQGLKILSKYGGKEDSRTKVDRAVEKASGKTRRKPQTENEKTAKVQRREEAQRILRELQGGEKNSPKTRRKPQIKDEETAKVKVQEKKRTSKSADKIKSKTKEKFNFSQQVGEGAYGEVYLDPAKGVVQKKLKRGEFSETELKLADEMGKQGFSPKVYLDRSDSKTMVMELAKGKTGFPTNKAEYPLEVSKDLFRGMIYLQKKLGYVHNDLHPQNILVDLATNKATIIDFGVAKPVRENLFKSFAEFNRMRKFVPYEELRKDPEFKGITTIIDKYWRTVGTEEDEKRFLKEYSEWLDS